MSLSGVFSALLVSIYWLFVVVAENVTQPVAGTRSSGTRSSGTRSSGTNSTGTNSTGTNSTRTNSTAGGTSSSDAGFAGFGVDSSMMQRALYVLIGITMVGVLYFLVRAVRLKRPIQKKKYGLLSNYDESLEMDGEDSDEDDTLYEARSPRR